MRLRLWLDEKWLHMQTLQKMMNPRDQQGMQKKCLVIGYSYLNVILKVLGSA